MLTQLLDIVKVVAQREIVPRYLKVAHERKVDGSIITAADTAAQQALSEGLHALNGCPVLGEEMTPEEQQALWAHRDTGLWVLDPVDGSTVEGILRIIPPMPESNSGGSFPLFPWKSLSISIKSGPSPEIPATTFTPLDARDDVSPNAISTPMNGMSGRPIWHACSDFRFPFFIKISFEARAES